MNPRWIWRRWVKRFRQWYLLLRDGKACAYCHCALVRWKPPPIGKGWSTPGPKGRQLTLDHVIPRSMGGTNRLSNLVLACATCNSRKGSMSAIAYRQSVRLAERKASIKAEAMRGE